MRWLERIGGIMKKRDFLGFPDMDGDGDVDLLDVMILNDILNED